MRGYLLIILVTCVLLVPVYYKTKRFNRFWGILMFILGFGALFLRLSILKTYPLLGFFNSETIRSSALLIFTPAIIFLFFGVCSENFKRRIKKLKKLLLPYILFGGLQQIFFFWVFCDSIYYLTKNSGLVSVLTILFYFVMHLSWRGPFRRFWILLIPFAIINTWTYLVWGNIAPQLIVYGIVASVLFTEFSDTDLLKRRLG